MRASVSARRTKNQVEHRTTPAPRVIGVQRGTEAGHVLHRLPRCKRWQPVRVGAHVRRLVARALPRGTPPRRPPRLSPRDPDAHPSCPRADAPRGWPSLPGSYGAHLYAGSGIDVGRRPGDRSRSAELDDLSAERRPAAVRLASSGRHAARAVCAESPRVPHLPHRQCGPARSAQPEVGRPVLGRRAGPIRYRFGLTEKGAVVAPTLGNQAP